MNCSINSVTYLQDCKPFLYWWITGGFGYFFVGLIAIFLVAFVIITLKNNRDKTPKDAKKHEIPKENKMGIKKEQIDSLAKLIAYGWFVGFIAILIIGFHKLSWWAFTYNNLLNNFEAIILLIGIDTLAISLIWIWWRSRQKECKK